MSEKSEFFFSKQVSKPLFLRCAHVSLLYITSFVRLLLSIEKSY